MADDTEATAAGFLQLATACAGCKTELEFASIVRVLVKPLFPHKALLAAIGRVDIAQIEIHRVIGVDHPIAHLEGLGPSMAMRDRPVIVHWLKTLRPLILRMPNDAQLMSEREIEEIECHGLGCLGIHGVVDLCAKTGSYLSFSGLPSDVTDVQHARMLELLAPPLSQALMRVERACHEGESVDAALSRTERELLGWVAAGRTNRDIATLRNRSVATVRNQLHSAFRKLGAGNRTDAIRLMLGASWISDLPKK